MIHIIIFCNNVQLVISQQCTYMRTLYALLPTLFRDLSTFITCYWHSSHAAFYQKINSKPFQNPIAFSIQCYASQVALIHHETLSAFWILNVRLLYNWNFLFMKKAGAHKLIIKNHPPLYCQVVAEVILILLEFSACGFFIRVSFL